MKPMKLGSVNACGMATLFNGKGKAVATCLATPNNIAAAFLLCPKAERVKAAWPEEISAKRLAYADRFNGLDMAYHKRHITVY